MKEGKEALTFSAVFATEAALVWRLCCIDESALLVYGGGAEGDVAVVLSSCCALFVSWLAEATWVLVLSWAGLDGFLC